MIIHGDADRLVPLQQSQTFVKKLQSAGVPCKLVVKKNAGHGIWPGMDKDVSLMVDWFDQYLLKKGADKKAG